jgi:quinol monooxygenase YgiN
MITRIVRMTFKKEHVNSFLSLFEKNKEAIASFDGCAHLSLFQDADNPCIYITYSEWKSEKELNTYRNSELFKRVWKETKSYFDSSPLAFSMKKA